MSKEDRTEGPLQTPVPAGRGARPPCGALRAAAAWPGVGTAGRRYRTRTRMAGTEQGRRYKCWEGRGEPERCE